MATSPKRASDSDSGYSSSPPSPLLQPRHRSDRAISPSEPTPEPECVYLVPHDTYPILERGPTSRASSPSPSLQHHHPNHIPPPPSRSNPPPLRRPRRKQVIITQSIEHLAAEYSAKRVRYRDPPPPCPVLPSGKYALMPDVGTSGGHAYVNSAASSNSGACMTEDGHEHRYSRSEGHMGTLEEHAQQGATVLRPNRRVTNASFQDLGDSRSFVREKRRPRGLAGRRESAFSILPLICANIEL